MALVIALAALQAAPGAAPPEPVEANLITPRPPAAATFVPPRLAEPVADPKTVVAQPAPGANVPGRPQVGEPGPSSGVPAPPPAAAPAPAPPSGQAPPVAAPAPTPAAASPPAPSPRPEVAAPGFSTEVVGPAAIQADPPREPEGRGQTSLWWVVLGGVLIAGAGAAASRMRRKRLVERTRNLLSVDPRLDTGRIAPSVPNLAFAAPPAGISTRLEAGAARTWAV